MKALPSRARRSVFDYIAMCLIWAYCIAVVSWFTNEAFSLGWAGVVFWAANIALHVGLASHRFDGSSSGRTRGRGGGRVSAK